MVRCVHMEIIYTNQDIENELKGVEKFFAARSVQKNYPHEYRTKAQKLIKQMYEVSKFKHHEEILKNETIKEAFIFSQEKHAGQFRQFFNLSYIFHPCEMASRLSGVPGSSKEQIIAALLHDTVEDCGVKLENIKNKFGDLVATHVHFLTDYATLADGTRAQQTELNFNHFIKSPEETKNIKLTDLLSNTRSIVFCNPSFAKVYTPSLERAMEYFKQQQKYIDSTLYRSLICMTEISLEAVRIQDKFDIIKSDRKKSNQILQKIKM